MMFIQYLCVEVIALESENTCLWLKHGRKKTTTCEQKHNPDTV